MQTTFQGPSGNASRTVEAWVKTTANCIPNQGGIQQVIVDWGTFVTGGRFTMNLLWSNALRLEVGGNGLSGSIAVNDGNWHHVAVVYNSSLATNQYSLYVDGVLDVSGNLTVSTNTSNTGNMVIGRRTDGVNSFNGEIDEVRVFDFPRTAAQINADKDKELCSTTTGLLAYYKLNEGMPTMANSGNTIAKDYSGNGNNGTLMNFALNGATSNWVLGPVINPRTTYSTFSASECTFYLSPSGNQVITSSGIYLDTIPNASGCDSIMTIDVQIGASSSNLNVAECVSYTSPSGKVFTNSAMFMDTILSNSGCDSIISINLTIGASSAIIDTSVCGSFANFDGTTYNISGVYIDTLAGASAAGCDSIITLNLTVNAIDSTFETLFTCQDSLLIANTWYSSAQTINLHYTNSAGCDSTHSVLLTFGMPSSATIDVTSCGTYTSPSGQTFGSSVSFVETYTNASGCDSVVQFNLTVYQETSTDINLTACDSAIVNGVLYTTSQMISYVLTDVNGCDSTVNVDLTINTIDATVSATNNILEATAYTGASYTWYNCNTNQVVSALNNNQYTATESGSYKVEITHLGCTKESECVNVEVVIENINEINSTAFDIIPNPNNGNFELRFEDNFEFCSCEILNVIGKKILIKELNNSKVYITKYLEPGIYFVKLNSKKGSLLKKFVVK